MHYYPLCLDVRDRVCLVVGGGRIALDKARPLVKAGARVRVVAPDIAPEFRETPGIEVRERRFVDTDLDGVFLGIGATDDRATNERFAGLCRERGILHNVVDVPDLCQFIVPAVVERGGLTLCIYTQGTAPALSGRLRQELEAWLPNDIEEYIAFLDEARARAKRLLPSLSDRAALGRYLASRKGYERFVALPAERRSEWIDTLINEYSSGASR